MDMDALVASLQKVWKEEKGEKLSYSKAKRRIESAIAQGCTMSADCSKCPKVRECPILNDENEKDG